MAQWNSSLLHRPSSPAHIDGKFKDLLPPRKRLLAGLKHIDASATVSSPLTSFPAQSCHVEVHTETTTTHSPLPPCSLLLHSPSHKCLSCGDGSVVLHRVPCLGGATSYFCSSCVLSFNKKLYCIECLQIIERGPLTSSSLSSPPFLTCCRCQRLTHLDCALKMWVPSLEGSGLTLCKDCYARNNGQYSQPPTKKQKTAGLRRSKQAVVSACKMKLPEIDKQSLMAAKIVAFTAKKDAFEAMQRATVLAKAAARAAAHAKAALDNVYMLCQRRAGNEELAVVVDTESKDGARGTTARTSRGLKKRALSAIVASETLSIGNRMAATEKKKEKQWQTSSDADDGQDMSSSEDAVDAMSHRPAQKVKLGIKRRKTLSSLTKTHAIVPVKRPKSSAKKSIGPSVSSKGKLGAIVSHVLSLSKGQKHPKAAEKGRGLWVHCEGLDDNGIDGVEGSIHRTLTVSSDCLPRSGKIGSIDACKPSYYGSCFSGNII